MAYRQNCVRRAPCGFFHGILANEVCFVKEDDVSYICNAIEKDWIEVVASFKKLPTCNAKREKLLYYVDADEEYVTCNESGEWELLDANADMGN